MSLEGQQSLLVDPGGPDPPTHTVQILHVLSPRGTVSPQHQMTDLGPDDQILDPLLELHVRHL